MGVRGRYKTITYDTKFVEFGDFAKFGYSKGQRRDGNGKEPESGWRKKGRGRQLKKR